MMVPFSMMKNMFRKEIQGCLATNLEKYKNQLRIEGAVYNKILSKKKENLVGMYTIITIMKRIYLYIEKDKFKIWLHKDVDMLRILCFKHFHLKFYSSCYNVVGEI